MNQEHRKTQQKPRLAILVVGYKSRLDLEDCFTSIFASTYRNFSVYFLNNGIDDGSVVYVKESFPSVHVVDSKKNLGFASGNNALIALALQEKENDALFFLNPDTILDPLCLTKLAESFHEDLAAQPLVLLSRDGKKQDIVNSSGNPLHYLGFSYAGDNGKLKSSIISSSKRIAIGSGAAIMVPRKILEYVGGFDDTFFTYHEDVDLSYRINSAGFTIQLLPKALVWHKYVFSKNKLKFYYVERNRILFLLQNYQVRTLILLLPMWLITELMMIVYSILGGWTHLKIAGYWHILRTLPSTLQRRKKIQSLRKITDRQLYATMTATLSFSEIDSSAVKRYNTLSKFYWSLIRYV